MRHILNADNPNGLTESTTALTVTGPYTVYKLTKVNNEGETITAYLFGERHTNQVCTKTYGKESQSIVHFLLAALQRYDVDVYLEIREDSVSYASIANYEEANDTSALTQANTLLLPYIPPGLYESSDKKNIANVKRELLPPIKGKVHSADFRNYHISAISYREFLATCLGNTGRTNTSERISTMKNIYRKNTYLQKELDRSGFTKEEQEKMYEHVANKICKFSDENLPEDVPISKVPDDNPSKAFDIAQATGILDMYFLARMLVPGRSKHIIFYGGALHAKSIAEMMQNIFNFQQTAKIDNEEVGGPLSSCVTLDERFLPLFS